MSSGEDKQNNKKNPVGTCLMGFCDYKKGENPDSMQHVWIGNTTSEGNANSRNCRNAGLSQRQEDSHRLSSGSGLKAGQLHLCHHRRVECGVMGIKTCLHAFFCSTPSMLPTPLIGRRLSTVRPYFPGDRGQSVTQAGQSEYLFS